MKARWVQERCQEKSKERQEEEEEEEDEGENQDEDENENEDEEEDKEESGAVQNWQEQSESMSDGVRNGKGTSRLLEVGTGKATKVYRKKWGDRESR